MTRFLVVIVALGLAPLGPLAAQSVHSSKHAAAGDAEAGETVFQHSCVMCHALTPDTKIVGPSLYSEMHGQHAKSAAAVRQIVVHGKGTMPALGTQLSETDLANLLAYLRTK